MMFGLLELRILFVFGFFGHVHRGHLYKNRFRSITGEPFDTEFSNFNRMIGLCEYMNPFVFGVKGSNVKVTGITYVKIFPLNNRRTI